MKLGKIFLISAVLLATSYTAVRAHDTVFFEYAPDAWQSKRHVVSQAATPYQVFRPSQNFTMTGFDLWVDNTSSAGSVTFTLTDTDGSTIATKSATLSSLPITAGGNKFHVDWTAPVDLLSSETYSLKISSSLLGFGLYYADKITIAEHNQENTVPYANGEARLGQDAQAFTFKFALYGPVAVNTSPSTPPPPPAAPQGIVISNARVVSITDTTAIFAWTTNVAADSRANARTQLNPLYVISTAYDPTLELEHAVLVTGLSPGINYFADMLSGTNTGGVVNTYTVSFQTTQGNPLTPPPTPNPNPSPSPNPTTPPPSPNPNPTPNPQSPPPAPPSPTPPSSPSPSPNPNPTPNPNPSPSPNPNPSPSPSPTPPTNNQNPEISIGSGGGGGLSGNPEISWPASQSGEPQNGYRVDIFDYSYALTKQITVPAGQHSEVLPELESGVYHAVVYANDDGVYTKVAPAKDFTLTASSGSTLNKVIIISLLWIAGVGGYIYFKNRKKETGLTTETG